MAGVITHLIVADKMLELLPENTVKDDGLFYLGTLVPDSIHAREGYIRAYKKHTHLRDDIADKDFDKKENLDLFHQRVSEFILANRDRTDGLLDLYRGYVVHILTDELFMLTIRKEFCKTMEALGIAQDDKRFFEYIVTDMTRNDLLLVKQYHRIDQIRKKMEEVAIYPVEDYLTEQEIRASRDWLIRRHFIEKNEIIEPVYISFRQLTDFIEKAAVNITDRLRKESSLPKMF